VISGRTRRGGGGEGEGEREEGEEMMIVKECLEVGTSGRGREKIQGEGSVSTKKVLDT
jgi:hypothetical protein